MNETEVIDMVAHSSEIENIVVRDEEQNELEMLVRSSCPLEVKVLKNMERYPFSFSCTYLVARLIPFRWFLMLHT